MSLIKSIAGLRGTIGGQIGSSLTPIDVVKFTTGYGSWLKEKVHNPKVIIGRDARPSGQQISPLVSNTLLMLGVDVIDIGLTTTPTVEMAVLAEKANGGIILTASHNPSGWNALKLLNDLGEFISASDGIRVLELAEDISIKFVEPRAIGRYTTKDFLDYHIRKVLDHELVDVEAIRKANFKIAVDAVNSTGGIAVPRLLKELQVEVKEINCEPNGHFAHNPEPLPENITQLCNEVTASQLHLGIAVDPDVDRLVFVCEDGQPFGEEYTLVAVSDYVLKRRKGNTVSNLSSSRALRDVTEKNNGHYYASAVGEVNVVLKMKEVNAVIGGEGNGGIIMPDLHYGRDALIGIGLFLSHLAHYGKSSSLLKAQYPQYHISKNKIELEPELDLDHLLQQLEVQYRNNPINTEDGLKIEFDKEWVHLRKSNTEPIIRIYAESDSVVTADHLAKKIISDIKEIIVERTSD